MANLNSELNIKEKRRELNKVSRVCERESKKGGGNDNILNNKK